MAAGKEFTMERDEDVPASLLRAAKNYERELHDPIYANLMHEGKVVAIVELSDALEGMIGSDHDYR